jgi:dihydrofolate synthase/folylpolyglutamate synthase
VDVGHNEDGLRWIVKQLNETPHRRLHWVLGVVNDKDVSAMLSLMPKSAIYYFCKADIPRGLSVSELHQRAAEFDLRGEAYPSVRSAYDAALHSANKDDLVFIGGSFFTVAEVL